ncbi:hypothetical protein LIER_37972 [Lithospermum erythrorhizon]|uniref:Transposase n=1 Tax=Lithospermum erythrorhizon TaxID=34254 RepID=A0AAV3PSV7_LITER
MGNRKGGKAHPGPWPKIKPNSRPAELLTLPPIPAATMSLEDMLDRTLVDDVVSGWFLPEIRFDWSTCWPKWKNVDADVKEQLWITFKNYFDLDVEESTARHLFYKQANKWYRETMHTTKKEVTKQIGIHLSNIRLTRRRYGCAKVQKRAGQRKTLADMAWVT